MRDKEYMHAFLAKLDSYFSDIYAEVIDVRDISNTDIDTIIITDIDISSFEQSCLSKISAQLMFITNRSNPPTANCIFKYDSFNNIITQIAKQYYSLTGDRVRFTESSEIICVCGDADDYNYKCVNQSIARKSKYNKGGDFLLLSLTPINRYGYSDQKDKGILSKLIYTLDSGKDFYYEEFCKCDEYGVYYLYLGIGLNRLTLLDSRSLMKLLEHLKKYFTGIVIDIGSMFTKENIQLINEADSIWWISKDNTDYISSELVENIKERRIYILDYYNNDVDMDIDEIINTGGNSD